MRSRTRALAGAAALALVAGFLSFWRLSDAPIFLGRDEVFVALSGHAVATTGRDLEHHAFPLYFFSNVHGNWWAPVLPYALAAILNVVPLSEASARSPLAIAAVLDVVLVFFAGRLLFERRGVAWIAALVLALAPLHIIESRFANDTALPATFAAAWALAMLSHAHNGGTWKLGAAGAALGIGCFCYVGAVPLMPLYAGVTIAALALRRAPVRNYAAFLAAFTMPLVLGGVWLARHPDVIETTFLHYQSDQVSTLGGQTLSVMTTMRRLADVAGLYRRFWDPTVVFMFGAPWLMHSTRRAGIVLIAAAGVIVVGLLTLAGRSLRDSRALVVLGGCLLAPIPASLVDVNEHSALHATWRAAAILPFASLLAGVGVDFLLTGRDTWWRKGALITAVAVPLALVALYGVSLPHRTAVTWLLIAAAIGAAVSVATWLRPVLVQAIVIALAAVALVQFWDFYADYIGDYQQRFTVETDGNVRDVLEAVIDRLPPIEPGSRSAVPAAYLGFRLGAGDWAGFYWRFYLHKKHREDLLARTINDTNASKFDEAFVCHLPPGSVLATPAHKDPPTDALIESMIRKGEVTHDSLVGVVRGRPTFWLLETTGACAAE